MDAPVKIYTEEACIGKDKLYFDLKPNQGFKDVVYIRLDKVEEIVMSEFASGFSPDVICNNEVVEAILQGLYDIK